MSQINSKVKEDFQVDLLLSSFVGHTVLAVKLDKCKIGRQLYSNTYRFLIELSRYIIV